MYIKLKHATFSCHVSSKTLMSRLPGFIDLKELARVLSKMRPTSTYQVNKEILSKENK